MRALPAGVVEDLYAIADPTSARNPFRSEGQRWRNYALFLLYLHQGLRRGERLEGVDHASSITRDPWRNTKLSEWQARQVELRRMIERTISVKVSAPASTASRHSSRASSSGYTTLPGCRWSGRDLKC